jgi:hypothetical protein
MQHFNEDFVSIISTLHVSAFIGHLQVLTVLYLFILTYCNKFAGSISQWKFITLKAQYTTVDYN